MLYIIYTIEEVLFATIFITDEQITDIKLEFDNAIKTKDSHLGMIAQTGNIKIQGLV